MFSLGSSQDKLLSWKHTDSYIAKKKKRIIEKTDSILSDTHSTEFIWEAFMLVAN